MALPVKKARFEYRVGRYVGDYAVLMLAFGLLVAALFVAFEAEGFRVDGHNIRLEACEAIHQCWCAEQPSIRFNSEVLDNVFENYSREDS